MLKDAPDNPKILLVYFAKETDRIPTNKEEDIAQFDKNKGSKNLSFEVANEESFPEQVARTDVIYLHGGSTLRLLTSLEKFADLKKLFEGKTIAGESAGAYVLSAIFYSENAGGIFKGLSLVPVKTICHYSEQKKGKLGEQSSDLEQLLLSDYQYRVFN